MKAMLVPAGLLLVLVLTGPGRVDGDDQPAKKPGDKSATSPDKPTAKLPLGKDTTYVVGPFDREGFIDYEAALNATLSAGITPETNANVLLLQALGPKPEGSPLPLGYYKWLNAPPPPADGEYIVGVGTLARDRLALNDNQLQAIFDQQSWAAARPWKATDYPVIAEWLALNEKPLALVLEATKRPAYFNPLASRKKEGEPSNLIGVLLPTVQKCRELASMLSARAMLRAGEGKFDDAWRDILACYRLGRLTSRGGTIIEGLVGVAICTIAQNTAISYLAEAKLSSKQALERLREIQSLPPMASYADKLDITERLMGLDSIQLIRRHGIKLIDTLDNGPPDDDTLSAKERQALDAINWAPALRTMNGWYDRMAAAARIPDRAAREKALDTLNDELNGFYKQSRTTDEIGKLLYAKKPERDPAMAISIRVMALLMPSVRKVQSAFDRCDQLARNLEVAFAMAAYHADQGRYPAKLNELAPAYLKVVPGDLFSGKPLIYKPTEKGYLFYSVGQNGKDEGGRYFDDEPRGDDPRVRMPLPPLKKN